MTADLGTRRGAKLSDISENSSWISGQSWAKTDRSLFPIKSAEEIKLSQEDLNRHDAETIKLDLLDDDHACDQSYQ